MLLLVIMPAPHRPPAGVVSLQKNPVHKRTSARRAAAALLMAQKALRYFRMCDHDGSGEIDIEEFKVALFATDPDSGNPLGFAPSSLLTPLDAFEVKKTQPNYSCGHARCIT